MDAKQALDQWEEVAVRVWARQRRRHPDRLSHSCGRAHGHDPSCIRHLNDPLYQAVQVEHVRRWNNWVSVLAKTCARWKGTP